MTELEGEALDAAVALALGYQHLGAIGTNKRNDKGQPWCLSGCNDWWKDPEGHMICAPCYSFPRQYSEDWNEAGPIIEREQISLIRQTIGWCADMRGVECQFADAPMVAAMRAFVASRAG